MKTSIAVVGILFLTGCLDVVRETEFGDGGAGGGVAAGAGGGTAGGAGGGTAGGAGGGAAGGAGGGAAGGAGGGQGGGVGGGAGGGQAQSCDTCKGNVDCGVGEKCGAGGVTCITCPCLDVCQPIGSTGDGGWITDGGIAAPVALTEPQCTWNLPVASCAGDAGTCLVIYQHKQKAQPPLEVLTQSQLGLDSYHFSFFANADWTLFTTYRSIFAPPGVSRLLALPALGGTPVALMTLQQPTDRFNQIYSAAANPSYGVWFIAEVDTAAGRTRNLLLSNFSGTGIGGAVVTNPNVPTPVSNGAAVGSDYFVAHADGVYGYYPAGGGRIAQTTGVTTLAATVSEVVFARCLTGSCSVHRYDRKTFMTQQLLGSIQDDIRSIVVLGTNAYAIGNLMLIKIPLAGGTSETIFRGQPFPQYQGTLEKNSLQVLGSKLTFGSVCEFDADAAGYGTIELDPVARTARWLNLEADFPQVEGVTPFRGANSIPTITSRGIYTWIVR